jgi:hypothetical protein
MDFTDLDLQGDNISSGSNKATLFETFALMDKSGSVLAVLNRSYPDDDDFIWTYNLSDALFDGTTLNLDTYFTAALNLTQGTSISVGNSPEKVANVRICGES